MANQHRNQNLSRRTGRVPNRAWSSSISTAATTIAGTTKVLVSLFVPSNSGIDEVILRTRGVFGAWPGTLAAFDNFGAWGIAVVSDIALATGATAIPGPATDAGWDGWFVWQGIARRTFVATAVGTEDFGMTDFDSKAKRIVGTDYSLVLMVENVGGSSFVFGTIMRILSQVRGT